MKVAAAANAAAVSGLSSPQASMPLVAAIMQSSASSRGCRSIRRPCPIPRRAGASGRQRRIHRGHHGLVRAGCQTLFVFLHPFKSNSSAV